MREGKSEKEKHARENEADTSTREARYSLPPLPLTPSLLHPTDYVLWPP